VMSDDSPLDEPASWWLGAFARLKPGASLHEANAFLTSTSPRVYRATVSPHYLPDIAKEYLKNKLEAVPGNTGFSFLRWSVRTPLILLFSLAGLVLTIACANLANLLLARATVREHEIAVRLAVGASRWRVVQQLLSESMLIAALGSGVGTALAALLSRYLVRAFSTNQDTVFLNLSFDARFVAFLIGATVFTCLLFGLAPALRASRRQPSASMKSAGRGATSGRQRFGFERALVAAQISLSLVLLVGSLLFVRSFQKLMTLDPGFRSNGVLIANVGFRADAVPQERRMALFDDILRHLRTIPGVDSASAVFLPPIWGGYSSDRVHIDGDAAASRPTNFNRITEGYFQTMDIPLLAGRDFTEHDDASSAPVVIVDATFAAKFLRGKNPVGRTLYTLPGPGQPIKRYTIVGLAGRSKYPELQREFEPTVYVTLRQRDNLGAGMRFVVHSGLPLATAMKAVENTVMSVNSQLGVDLESFPTKIHDSVRREDVMAELSGFFGLLAVVLATVGLYGVMSYIVTHRRTEIGIRLAIGATPKSILTMILKQSIVLLIAGIAVGAVLSLVCSRWAQSLLFEVRASDPAIVAAAALGLALVTVAATLIPAMRAANLDPMTTLRDE
jgi:putative ABC transport system permease protein